MTRLCFDFDAIVFPAVAASEDRYITATHRITGREMEFENKTELWGHWKTKTGGWIGVQNALSKNEYWKAEDFDVVQGQRLRLFKTLEGGTIPAIEGAKKLIDDQIAAVCKRLGASSYFGYTGTGDVFRHRVATLMPYKGQREDTLRPILLSAMKQHVIDKHNCTLVEDIEADDAVSMATIKGYESWKEGGKLDEDRVIAIAVDKDAKQTEGWHFNHSKDKEPRLIEGLGRLWLDEKGDIDGAGRMWLYYQVAAGDTSDNYKPNCFSTKKYAEKGAYKDLHECTTDKEAFTALVRVFKMLYPEKQTVETHVGTIEIDWLYVMQEMFTLAMMLRKPDDKIDVKVVLDKLGVSY